MPTLFRRKKTRRDTKDDVLELTEGQKKLIRNVWNLFEGKKKLYMMGTKLYFM